MFVPESFMGRGLGRILAGNIVQAARDMGYQTMRLDTGVRQVAAIRLYSSLGFQKIGPITKYPQIWLRYYKLE
ncbi:MAG: putative acetyltransferase [Gammaproteobacteria bacterium]|jgi:putative acetyltransferase